MDVHAVQCATRCSMTAFFTDFCSFSNARTSICRTRSREMPYRWLRFSNVVGLSLSLRSEEFAARDHSVPSAPASNSRRLLSSDEAKRTS